MTVPSDLTYREQKQQLQDLAIQRLWEAKERRAKAKTEYDAALLECVELRVSNIKMASVVGVTEAGIRLYRKRHGI